MNILIDTMSKKGGRANNEDHCGYYSEGDKHILALADGLGGHAGGEIASKTAVQTMLGGLKEDVSDAIKNGFEIAQKAILSEQEKDKRYSSMRTTLVAAVINNDSLSFGHIGDSRLYIFRKGQVFYVTSDHSVVYMLYKSRQYIKVLHLLAPTQYFLGISPA